VDERQAEQERRARRAGLRALPTPTDLDLQPELVQDAPALLEVLGDLPEPRISELDALLRDVDELRSTMRRDLTLAATAAKAGETELAGWLLLGDDGRVRSFEERALAHLQELEAGELLDEAPVVPAQRRRRRLLPAAPMVAACAALFGFLTGSVPGTSLPAESPATSNVALDSYARLTTLATNGGSDDSITAAAEQFHADLAPLVAAASTDPIAAQKALALLRSERAVFASGVDSPALRAVLRQADLLVAKLQASLPRKPVRPTVVLPAPQQQSKPKASPAPKSSPAPKPSPTASPTASPKPTPTSSAKPSPAPSSSNPLPGSPFQQ
jgi:hypothetical protein